MDQIINQIVSELLKLGLAGIVIIGEAWIIIKLFGKYEEKGQQQREDAKVWQEDSRKTQSLIAELIPVLREYTALRDDVRELLQELRGRNGRRR